MVHQYSLDDAAIGRYRRAMTDSRRYSYVGPTELQRRGVAVDSGSPGSPDSVRRWLISREENEAAEPYTFVVALDGTLLLGPRRSEHVALARGTEILAAGEITFATTANGWRVTQVSNQSTGYCPDPDSWPAVAQVLDHLELPHPDDFTDKITFRRCISCGERNIVRDGDFTCAICDSELPRHWNFDSG
jgi:hypothetical protein